MELKLLKINDVTQKYVSWFSSKEVIKFSDNQYSNFTLESQKQYVYECINNEKKALFGLFTEGEHIGNIILKNICSFHRRAEIGYVIGEKKYWGKGFGKKAVKLIIYKAKNEFKLNKLYASTVKENIGSIKVLEKNSFKLEGLRINHLYYNERFYDQLDYGLIL
tara:strand:+ start:401 stop:892 length:492 start_codon:yes stop_codon:yes gene_type:complete